MMRCNALMDDDDLHAMRNIEELAQGVALDDDDPAPWLEDAGQMLAQHGCAIGCSALKKTYRDWIKEQVDETVHFLIAQTKGYVQEKLI